MVSQDPTKKRGPEGGDAHPRAPDRDRRVEKEEKEKAGSSEPLDEVEEADRESFPASDPPSWTGVTIDKHNS